MDCPQMRDIWKYCIFPSSELTWQDSGAHRVQFCPDSMSLFPHLHFLLHLTSPRKPRKSLGLRGGEEELGKSSNIRHSLRWYRGGAMEREEERRERQAKASLKKKMGTCHLHNFAKLFYFMP